MNTKTRNTLLTYLFLLLTFFILVLFTKDLYGKIVEQKNSLQTLKTDLADKQTQAEKLAQIKQEIDAGKYAQYNFEKYLINFSEDELSTFFYDYAKTNPGRVKIETLTFAKWAQNEFGFMEGTIDLSLTFATELDMLNMMSFLLTNEKYNFYIHQFTYPLWEITGPFSVEIPLKVLYK